MSYQAYIERKIEKYIQKLGNPDTVGEAMDGLQKIVKSGQEEEKITHQELEELIEIHPDSVILLDINAWLYRQVGNREKALRYYQKCYNIFPCKESLSEIFYCYYYMGQYDKALAIAVQIVTEYGNSHKILVVKTKLKMYDHNEAVKLIEQSLDEIDSFENKFAEEALAFAGAERCFKIGQYKKALSFLERAESSLKIGNGKHIKELRSKIKQKQKLSLIVIIILGLILISTIVLVVITLTK